MNFGDLSTSVSQPPNTTNGTCVIKSALPSKSLRMNPLEYSRNKWLKATHNLVTKRIHSPSDDYDQLLMVILLRFPDLRQYAKNDVDRSSSVHLLSKDD